jgi:osmotically inducible lipoprotein OsmB
MQHSDEPAKENDMKQQFRIAAALAAFGLVLGGCAGMTHQEKSTAVGAVAGGVVGSAATGGSTLGTVGGAVAGGVIGNEVGKR